LLTEVRRILRKYPLNTPITSLDEHHFLCDLIERHPYYKVRFTSKVRYFFPGKNLGFAVALFAKLEDGRVLDCCFRNCIRQRCKTHVERVKAAFRWEVRISKPRGCDAHHAGEYSFASLYALFWLEGNHGSEADVKLDDDGKLLDAKLAQSWKKFHNARAEWEVLNRVEHQLKHRKAVKP
jgi:hypothetical protein